MERYKSLFAVVAFFTIVASFWSWNVFERARPVAVGYPRMPSSPVTWCGSGFVFDAMDSTVARAKLMQGLGNLHYPVTTTSLEAQKFFEQGLRLIYAFNHWEAIQAFREAVRLDPDCAMAYWGLALAFGPNLNDWTPKDRERIALESIEMAKARKGRVSQVEKDLIDALATRYNGKAYDLRDSLNLAYAQAMKAIVTKYPDDAEVQTLCADAIMNTMPWDYWQTDGTAKPQTAEAKKLLESVILKFPQHPGAHHLYIHLVEASPTPELALKSANVLASAMPAAGHIVHMPAHIYVRVGDYASSIEANTKAVKVDEEYLSFSENQGMYRMMYYPHNVDFISFSSYMEGRSNLGILTALKLAYKGNFVTGNVPGPPGFSQYAMVEPMIAYTRFGKWTDILALPDPGAQNLYAQVMWRFSRGLAFLRSGYDSQADRELLKLDSLNKLDTLNTIYITFNPVSTSSQIATALLRGEILLKQKKFDQAVQSFQDAVKVEDGMRYNEPPDWKLPTRHYLGAALLDAGRFADAEKVYVDDLKVNRENGWSLTGLQRCQNAQGKKSEVAATAKRFAKAWKNSDIGVSSSRF
jgi:tetratricopeptide (TPR) repeat protein